MKEWEDSEETMLYCPNCKNPLLYVIMEEKEVYRKLPMDNENLERLEWTYSFVCSKCGHEVQGTRYEEEVPVRQKVEVECAICGNKFKAYATEGWVPICKECHEEFGLHGD